MELAIDFGASNIDAVLFKDNKPIEFKTFSKTTEFDEIKSSFPKVNKIITTGGKSSLIKGVIHIDEIDAIASGGAKLANLSKAIVVSCGTGTCITSFESGKSTHLTGSGVGGGTILGLTKLICNIDNINQIIILCNQGNISQDLSIGDIIGSNLGKMNAELTASNFGQIRSDKDEDNILAIVKMVAESILMLALSASDNTNDIVMVGRVCQIPKFKKIAQNLKSLYPKKTFIFQKCQNLLLQLGPTLPLKPN